MVTIHGLDFGIPAEKTALYPSFIPPYKILHGVLPRPESYMTLKFLIIPISSCSRLWQ